jgi:hypothetical protein
MLLQHGNRRRISQNVLEFTGFFSEGQRDSQAFWVEECRYFDEL